VSGRGCRGGPCARAPGPGSVRSSLTWLRCRHPAPSRSPSKTVITFSEVSSSASSEPSSDEQRLHRGARASAVTTSARPRASARLARNVSPPDSVLVSRSRPVQESQATAEPDFPPPLPRIGVHEEYRPVIVSTALALPRDLSAGRPATNADSVIRYWLRPARRQVGSCCLGRPGRQRGRARQGTGQLGPQHGQLRRHMGGAAVRGDRLLGVSLGGPGRLLGGNDRRGACQPPRQVRSSSTAVTALAAALVLADRVRRRGHRTRPVRAPRAARPRVRGRHRCRPRPRRPRRAGDALPAMLSPAMLSPAAPGRPGGPVNGRRNPTAAAAWMARSPRHELRLRCARLVRGIRRLGSDVRQRRAPASRVEPGAVSQFRAQLLGGSRPADPRRRRLASAGCLPGQLSVATLGRSRPRRPVPQARAAWRQAWRPPQKTPRLRGMRPRRPAHGGRRGQRRHVLQHVNAGRREPPREGADDRVAAATCRLSHCPGGGRSAWAAAASSCSRLTRSPVSSHGFG